MHSQLFSKRFGAFSPLRDFVLGSFLIALFFIILIFVLRPMLERQKIYNWPKVDARIQKIEKINMDPRSSNPKRGYRIVAHYSYEYGNHKYYATTDPSVLASVGLSWQADKKAVLKAPAFEIVVDPEQPTNVLIGYWQGRSILNVILIISLIEVFLLTAGLSFLYQGWREDRLRKEELESVTKFPISYLNQLAKFKDGVIPSFAFMNMPSALCSCFAFLGLVSLMSIMVILVLSESVLIGTGAFILTTPFLFFGRHLSRLIVDAYKRSKLFSRAILRIDSVPITLGSRFSAKIEIPDLEKIDNEIVADLACIEIPFNTTNRRSSGQGIICFKFPVDLQIPILHRVGLATSSEQQLQHIQDPAALQKHSFQGFYLQIGLEHTLANSLANTLATTKFPLHIFSTEVIWVLTLLDTKGVLAQFELPVARSSI